MSKNEIDSSDINVVDPFKITPVQQAAASCTGAVITSLLVTPLDVVKTRLQVQQKNTTNCFLYCNGLMDHLCSCQPEDKSTQWIKRPSRFNGTIDAFIKISKTEGISSLWSGLSPTLVLAIPATVIYFVTYEQLRSKFRLWHIQSLGKDKEIMVSSGLISPQPYWIPIASGASARVISVSIVSPLELIRTKMQSQKLNYAELQAALRTLIQMDGIKGLWKGVFPTLLRDVPFSAIYWLNYETIKAYYGSKTPTFWSSFAAGAISGTIAATVTVPFDVVKTHQQIEFGENTLYSAIPKKSKGTWDVCKEIISRNGVRGLFAGIVPRVVKVAPACAIMISTFEYSKVFFNRLAHTSDNILVRSSQNVDNTTIHSDKLTNSSQLVVKNVNFNNSKECC